MIRVSPAKQLSHTTTRKYEHTLCSIFAFSIRLPHKHIHVARDDDANVVAVVVVVAIRFVFVVASKSIVSIERPLGRGGASDNKTLDMSSINSSSTSEGVVVIVVVAVVINVDDIALNECITASLPMFTVVFPKYKLAFVVTATPETTVSPINFAPVETPLPIEKIPLCMPSNRPVLEDLIVCVVLSLFVLVALIIIVFLLSSSSSSSIIPLLLLLVVSCFPSSFFFFSLM
mmetsp:Transcript_5265/g.16730  ORF Transcript_5265/g.16730 Transcript_5265/m.16730 type:complete len:231 (+) Transcript_5265:576-1268(+)